MVAVCTALWCQMLAQQMARTPSLVCFHPVRHLFTYYPAPTNNSFSWDGGLLGHLLFDVLNIDKQSQEQIEHYLETFDFSSDDLFNENVAKYSQIFLSNFQCVDIPGNSRNGDFTANPDCQVFSSFQCGTFLGNFNRNLQFGMFACWSLVILVVMVWGTMLTILPPTKSTHT